MNHELITERIRKLGAETKPGPACPDDHLIAAAIDGRLNAEHREQFDHHVADCDYCLTRLGSLSRLGGEQTETPVSDITLARAKRLGKRGDKIRRAPRWATAAVVVLAMGFVYNQYLPDIDVPDGNVPKTSKSLLPRVATPQADFRQARNINTKSLRPKILTPDEGALIDLGNTLFRWTEISDSLYYNIRIVTWEGDMVWQERVNATEWALSGNFELEPGAEYYVRVDAYLAEAKSISSRHVLFKVK